MRNKTKALVRSCLFVATLCLVLFGSAFTAEAAAKYKTKLSKNILTVSKVSTGAAVVTIEAPDGETINAHTLVDGSLVYFTTTKTKTNGKYSAILYTYNVADHDYAYFTLPSTFGYYDLEELYDGSLYLTGWNPSSSAGLYRLNLTKGTIQKVSKGGYAYRYNHYFVCESTEVQSSFAAFPIYIYDAKAGTTTRYCKKAAAYTKKNQYIYVAILNTVTTTPQKGASYRIVRYNLNTGTTKVLVNPLKAYSVDKITKYYVYSRKISGSKTTYYRYSYKLDKTITRTKAQYKKATGIA